jgi:hypothetical protein
MNSSPSSASVSTSIDAGERSVILQRQAVEQAEGVELAWGEPTEDFYDALPSVAALHDGFGSFHRRSR